MPATTFIAVCLGLIVLELAVMIAVFCVAMLKVRDAAQAVEAAPYRVHPAGRPVPPYTLKPGGFFGEMALLESLPRTATATAAETSRLHLLYRTKLDALLNAEPRVGITIMSHLARLLSARLRRVSGEAAV